MVHGGGGVHATINRDARWNIVLLNAFVSGSLAAGLSSLSNLKPPQLWLANPRPRQHCVLGMKCPSPSCPGLQQPSVQTLLSHSECTSIFARCCPAAKPRGRAIRICTSEEADRKSNCPNLALVCTPNTASPASRCRILALVWSPRRRWKVDPPSQWKMHRAAAAHAA